MASTTIRALPTARTPRFLVRPFWYATVFAADKISPKCTNHGESRTQKILALS